MAYNTLAYHFDVNPLTRVTKTQPVQSNAQAVLETIWASTSAPGAMTFSAWFHGDTPTPNVNDPANIWLSREAPNNLQSKDNYDERIPRCFPIPFAAKNLAVSVYNGNASGVFYANVTHVLN